ncbi:thiolase family protein [Neoactinobaculum massilliense]|uniref:thiolase family protein n=1 Tax=Neoactinobaculum massilliense TaxID=2364794 RepID=UPI000F523B2D|nr:thiolase family protein [Neoactinobaculum massilliense]
MRTPGIAVLGGARVPTGSFGGVYKDVPAYQLSAAVIGAAAQRAGIAVTDVDEFVIGNVGQTGPDAYLSRRASLAAGASQASRAYAINRLCGSGLQALWNGALDLLTGEADTVIAGGVESMSQQPFLDYSRGGFKLGNRTLIDGTMCLITDPMLGVPMGMTAERVAERYHISREDQDAFAVESQRRAQAAIKAGAFDRERIPFTVHTRKGDTVVTEEEHPRAHVTMEQLAKLRPVFKEGGTVTAGNASGINDGAAALTLTRMDTAHSRGLAPLAELVAFTSVGIDPALMGFAPTLAIPKVLKKAGLSLGDIGWIELNEAFASQAVAVMREAHLDPEITNPLGGAIALGHPLGATGAALALRAILGARATGVEFSLVTLCIGGGQAVAAIFRSL